MLLVDAVSACLRFFNPRHTRSGEYVGSSQSAYPPYGEQGTDSSGRDGYIHGINLVTLPVLVKKLSRLNTRVHTEACKTEKEASK